MAQPGSKGIVEELSGAFASARWLLSNLLDLFSLEARRAGLTLVLMLACGAVGAILVVAAWLCLLAALVLWSVSLGVNWEVALAQMALANLAARRPAVVAVRLDEPRPALSRHAPATQARPAQAGLTWRGGKPQSTLPSFGWRSRAMRWEPACIAWVGRLSQPGFLVSAVAAGTLLGYVLTRRGRLGALTGALAAGLARSGFRRLLARASTPTSGRPTPSP